MAQIIDGKAIAADIRQHIANQVQFLKTNHNLTPGLSVVLIGENPRVRLRSKQSNSNHQRWHEFFPSPKDATISEQKH